MNGFHATYDWGDDDSLSGTVVEAVAAASGRDPTDLARLYTALDPDALDAVFAPVDEGPPRTDGGRVEFTYEGYRIAVTAAGEITGRPLGDATDGVTTEAAFQAELARLVRAAEANGVDVDGGWVTRGGAARREFGIEIYEVRRAGGPTGTSRE